MLAWVLSGVIVLAVIAALVLGPTRFLVRAVAHKLAGPAPAKAWQWPASSGLGIGIVAAVGTKALTASTLETATIAALALLVLLALMDLAWRWLPFAWTIPLIAIGSVAAAENGAMQPALFGAMMGAGLLLAIQLSFRFLRGVEALGTGDIWLAGGIGTFFGPTHVSLILGVAALSALGVEAFRAARASSNKRTRMGVAYGAHICGAAILFFAF